MFFLFWLALMPSQAPADPLLETAVGTWTGRGWLKQSPEEPAEATRCRIRGSFGTASGQLVLSGRCAVAGRSGTFDAHITSQSGGAYDGRWSSQLAAGRATLRGRRSGNAIHFDVRAIDRQTGEALNGTMIWQFADDRFMIRSSSRLPDGASVIVSEMVFDR
jgi:hypothetical protein